MTESSSLTNFNFGFSTHKSDVLIHLSQWQYWWWFWFSLVWVLYFFIIFHIITKRSKQFNPIVNTSARGHGKWGDFLIAIIPLSWCGNILVNSNFILRMIEWQNEGSLFTLRVQGKQWYWVYKFDATSAQSILTAPKNVGHNNWVYTTPNESYTSNTYYSTLSLGAQLDYKQLYFKLLSDDVLTKKHIEQWGSLINNVQFSTMTINNKPTYHILTHLSTEANIPSFFNTYLSNESTSLIKEPTSLKFIHFPRKVRRADVIMEFVSDNKLASKFTKTKLEEVVDLFLVGATHPLMVKEFKTGFGFYDLVQLDDTSDYSANLVESVKQKPFTILKGVLNKHNQDIITKSTDTLDKPVIFVSKFLINSGALDFKIDDSNLLWGFRQKKYKRLQKFKYLPIREYNPLTLSVEGSLKSNPFALKSSLIVRPVESSQKSITSNDEALFNYQNAIKYNRHRGELVPVNLARRLLRTKRTLVLPAHINITVITNSYDVVHSWFIPGLGLKLDCVPGRSTHHSFYIDNVGFYYGQCAEICGRYHHHMPVRLCALPFEQFLVWWQRRGVKRLHRIGIMHSKLQLNTSDIKFRYNW